MRTLMAPAKNSALRPFPFPGHIKTVSNCSISLINCSTIKTFTMLDYNSMITKSQIVQLCMTYDYQLQALVNSVEKLQTTMDSVCQLLTTTLQHQQQLQQTNKRSFEEVNHFQQLVNKRNASWPKPQTPQPLDILTTAINAADTPLSPSTTVVAAAATTTTATTTVWRTLNFDNDDDDD